MLDVTDIISLYLLLATQSANVNTVEMYVYNSLETRIRFLPPMHIYIFYFTYLLLCLHHLPVKFSHFVVCIDSKYLYLSLFSQCSCSCSGGWDSSVGIATRYGVDGPGIESRWGRDFPHPSRPALGPTQPSAQWVPGLSPGVKRPGRGADPPPPSGTEVEGRVELYIYSPSGPSWPVLGRTLPFTGPG